MSTLLNSLISGILASNDHNDSVSFLKPLYIITWNYRNVCHNEMRRFPYYQGIPIPLFFKDFWLFCTYFM